MHYTEDNSADHLPAVLAQHGAQAAIKQPEAAAAARSSCMANAILAFQLAKVLQAGVACTPEDSTITRFNAATANVQCTCHTA
jgi:hypothetical protein